MARNTLLGSGLALVGLLAFSTAAEAQFQNNTSDIPSSGSANNSRSENIDFGDIDLDGDWDAVWADGGDADQDQNRIWINQGNLQGGTTGVFVDDTAARAPAVNDQSRDIEFADIDNDGDLDIYVSNTSAIVTQSNRWWINRGGIQAATIGFYTDDTSARWVGLSDLDSSVPTGAVLGTGGFKDWSCDCDFGDLDNDGDLDLVHSSYGGVASSSRATTSPTATPGCGARAPRPRTRSTRPAASAISPARRSTSTSVTSTATSTSTSSMAPVRRPRGCSRTGSRRTAARWASAT